MKLENISDANRLFTYKVAYDAGSAPNPFHGVCTLAICKPKIRSVAKAGDVIVGLSCGKDESRIVYCMLVSETISWSNYIELCKTGYSTKLKPNINHHFNRKIPKNENDQGDCIWKDAIKYYDAIKSWSKHNGEGDFETDVTNGKNVLIGEIFCYFGKGDEHEIRLPDNLEEIIPGRGHRNNANNSFKEEFVNFFNNELENRNIFTIGKMGTPALEPGKTDKQTCSSCRAEERESDALGEDS